eukprot:TRINITY_DN8563_c0_g1_i1.p1 TRINITY_DN8563_c0_g1~~TRINITY_DN8563_c0_g1_i1.p1  ORF type:complete len:455 (+),score=106.59 TRINITY_DN8563_c0_g1_i1:33-1397(+)
MTSIKSTATSLLGSKRSSVSLLSSRTTSVSSLSSKENIKKADSFKIFSESESASSKVHPTASISTVKKIVVQPKRTALSEITNRKPLSTATTVSITKPTLVKSTTSSSISGISKPALTKTSSLVKSSSTSSVSTVSLQPKAIPIPPVPKPKVEEPVQKPIFIEDFDVLSEDEEMLDSNVLDIDIGEDDPRECPDYVAVIFSNLLLKEKREPINPTYLTKQPELNARCRTVLIEWFIDVAKTFKLLAETVFLCVRLVDRFLDMKAIVKDNLQLIGVASMLVASKYEEIHHPTVADFVAICQNKYSLEEIIQMETMILTSMNFELNYPHPLHFLRRFSKAAQSDSKVHCMTKYLSEVSMIDYSMLAYRPSIVAAASVFLARKMLHVTPTWDRTLEHYTTYDEQDIIQCARELHQSLSKIYPLGAVAQSQKRPSALAKKYSESILYAVALIPPCAAF